jgi:hypothetical protein
LPYTENEVEKGVEEGDYVDYGNAHWDGENELHFTENEGERRMEEGDYIDDHGNIIRANEYAIDHWDVDNAYMDDHIGIEGENEVEMEVEKGMEEGDYVDDYGNIIRANDDHKDVDNESAFTGDYLGIFYYLYFDSLTYAFGWSAFLCRIRFYDAFVVIFFKYTSSSRRDRRGERGRERGRDKSKIILYDNRRK